MKQVVIPTVCAAGGLLLGALASPLRDQAPSAATTSAEDLIQLREQVSDLKRQGEQLLTEVAALRRQPVLAPLPIAEPEAVEMSRVEARLEESNGIAAQDEPRPVATDDLRQQVAVIVDELRAIEERRREEERREKAERGFEKRLARLADALDLTDYQTAELATALRSEADRLRTMREQLRDVDDKSVLRAESGAVREETLGRLAQFLSAEQLGQYETFEQTGKLGFLGKKPGKTKGGRGKGKTKP